MSIINKKSKLAMILITSISIFLLVIGIFAYPIFRKTHYILKLKENTPENLYEELPIYFNKNGLFQIKALINGIHEINLNLDTKAEALMREEDIAQYDGKYWGSMLVKFSNAYHEKEKITYSSLNSIKIGDFEIEKPHFKSVSKANLIHDIVDEGVWGVDLLSIGCWKFNKENQILKLFHPRNQELVEKETKGMVKIENGLRDNEIVLNIGRMEQELPFTFDLGYNGVVEINNEVADLLKPHHAYNEVRRLHKNGIIDTLYVFESIPISIEGIEVEKCQVVNIRKVNGNYIGAGFIKNFDFLMMYGDRDGHKRNEHLFLKKKENNPSKYTMKYISKFGLGITRQNGKTVIGSIATNSVADQAGLVLGDEVIEINGRGGEDFLIEQVDNLFIAYADSLDRLELKTKGKDIAEYTLKLNSTSML